MRNTGFRFALFVCLLVSAFAFFDGQSFKPVFFDLKDIRDVSKTDPTDGQVPAYVGSTGLYTPTSVTSLVTAATTSASGIVELATTAETNTGTDAARVVTPDGLAGSVFGTKTMILKIMAETTVVTSGDGKMYFTIPVEFNGMNLVSVGAHIYTADDAADPIVVDVYNFTDSSDMLSTAMNIEGGETDTTTSATPGTINAAEDDVVTGDVIRIDVTTYAGDNAAGLEIRLGFRLS